MTNTRTQKPLAQSLTNIQDPFEALRNKPGITVKDTARREPAQGG